MAESVKVAVVTEAAPAAIGPYAQAVRVGGMVWTSGQIPLDPATGAMVEGGIAEQTERVLESLTAVLAAAGCGLRDVVKTTVFLQDLGDFGAMNAVYGRYFLGEDGAGGEGVVPPARSTVEVAGLPRGARVEIEVVAVVRGS